MPAKRGFLEKSVVSSLVLATIMGTATPAFAASIQDNVNLESSKITAEYGVSVESAIQNIRNTIDAINNMRKSGSVSDSLLKDLSMQIMGLTQSTKTGNFDMGSVKSVLNDAEKAISGLSNASDARVAIAVARASMGIEDDIIMSNKKASITDFKDMPSTHWAYKYVDRMVKDGLFAGTSATTFSPDAPMTETQFLTVVLRKAFPDELTQYNAEFKSDWYMGAYQLGRDKGIISDSIYGTDAGAMNKRAITRERMTDMVIKTMELKGELVYGDANGVSKFVSDLGNCSSSCKDSMIKAYTMGIIAGTGGSKVSPKDTATRAQGATVLYRFAYAEERKAPDLSGVPEQPGANLEAPITIYEGQTRIQGESRLAREGDTFVKKDGTKIVLKKGPHGILGEGQGVAPDIGFKITANSGKTQTVANQERFSPGPSLDSKYQYNSIGTSVNNDTYKIDPWTGEGHWGDEWQVLINANPLPDRKGTQDGELSSDGIWVWAACIDK